MARELSLNVVVSWFKTVLKSIFVYMISFHLLVVWQQRCAMHSSWSHARLVARPVMVCAAAVQRAVGKCELIHFSLPVSPRYGPDSHSILQADLSHTVWMLCRVLWVTLTPYSRPKSNVLISSLVLQPSVLDISFPSHSRPTRSSLWLWISALSFQVVIECSIYFHHFPLSSYHSLSLSFVHQASIMPPPIWTTIARRMSRCGYWSKAYSVWSTVPWLVTGAAASRNHTIRLIPRTGTSQLEPSIWCVMTHSWRCTYSSRSSSSHGI